MEPLIEYLTDLPEKIKQEKIERHEIFLSKNKIEDNLSYIEANIKEEILNEKNENGKNKYSNETARKAEFEQRSKINEEYSNLNKKLNEIEKQLHIKNIEISYLEDKQKNIRAILNYGTDK